MARLIRRDFRPAPATLTFLPFIADVKVAPRKKHRNFWHVPVTDDYGVACNVGRQYACDFVQFLKDNPSKVGSNLIGHLVRDMSAFPGGTDMHGYEVGFWSTLERLLYRLVALENHWDLVQAVQDQYEAIAAARQCEAAEDGGHD